MKCLDLTLGSPAANLACDEALLDRAERQGGPAVLRFWESPVRFVVLGYANKVTEEADLNECRRNSIPIFRRCSGGGTVMQGPGCLNYSLILPVAGTGPQQTITEANTFVMGRNAQAVEQLLGKPVRVEGHTDLAVDQLKFSGNAQRRRRHWFLFHGTFLLGFDLQWIARCLRQPPRQPDYRRQRRHEEFLDNLPLSSAAVKQALRVAWNAESPDVNLDPGLDGDVQRLVEERYSRDDWNWSR